MGTILFVVVVLLVLAAIGGWFFTRSRFTRSRNEQESPKERAGKEIQAPKELTLESIQPGDAVVFWDGGSALVEAALDCDEHLRERVTRWRWVFLGDGRILEVSPHGKTVYGSTTVFYQGSAPFADLTADADQGGVLKSFEERVRDGIGTRDPITFIYDGIRYRMKSTGTFLASAKGGSLPIPWNDITATEGDNVYFKMGYGDDDEALGIWTTHIAFLTGKRLVDSDIKGLYAR